MPDHLASECNFGELGGVDFIGPPSWGLVLHDQVVTIYFPRVGCDIVKVGEDVGLSTQATKAAAAA
eukprot:6490419-Amphidinium_carterae.7